MDETLSESRKTIGRGAAALVTAVIINSFGVVLMLYSGSGISAISSVPFAFSEVIPALSLGTWTYLFQGLLVLILMVLRKRFVPQYLFSFVVGFAFGKLLDVHELWIGHLPDSFFWCVLYFVVSYLLISFGIALSNRCGLPIIPTDLFPRELAQITKIPYPRIKISFDVICLAVTAVMTGVFLGHLEGLGIGTILAAFTMGKAVGIMGDFLDRRTKRREGRINEKGTQVRGTLMTLAGGACWGFSGCCGQFLFETRGVQAPWLVALRLFFAGLLLIVLGFLMQGKENLRIFRNRRDWMHLLVFAFCGISFCQFTYFMAIQASNAGTATVLQYLSPILILIVLCVRERRRPKGLELAAIALSLGGTVVLGTHGDFGTVQISGQAMFWGLLAAVSAMIYTMLPGGLIRTYGICQVLGFGMFFGGAVMCLLVRPWSYEVIWDAGTLGAMAGVTVLGTAVAFGLYLGGVSIIGPLRGSILASVEPVSAVILSALWLGTAFLAADFAGFAMILCAVFLLTYAQQKNI